MSHTIAEIFHAEVGLVRDAVTAFENDSETYLGENPDDEHRALTNSLSTAMALEEAAQTLAEALRPRLREVEDQP